MSIQTTRKAETMTEKYERMLAKGIAEGYEVSIRFAHRATGKASGFFVSNGVKCHAVCVIDGQLVCSCDAGQNGTYCKHRAVARRSEIVRSEAAKAASLLAEAAEVLREDYAPAPRNMGIHLYRTAA